jgi:hypothetical protein
VLVSDFDYPASVEPRPSRRNIRKPHLLDRTEAESPSHSGMPNEEWQQESLEKPCDIQQSMAEPSKDIEQKSRSYTFLRAIWNVRCLKGRHMTRHLCPLSQIP